MPSPREHRRVRVNPINLTPLRSESPPPSPTSASSPRGILFANWESTDSFEFYAQKKKKLREKSAFGEVPSLSVGSMIVKKFDDMRQDQLVVQLLEAMQQACVSGGAPVWMRPFGVLVTSEDSALVETVNDAVSLHILKSKYPGFVSLKKYLLDVYGPLHSRAHNEALFNFATSLAGYSIACYLLQIKDRHNANILIDSDAHLVHVDFAFILGRTPGGIGWESAPFKFTEEFIEVLGGTDGEYFALFVSLLTDAFIAIRKWAPLLVGLLRVMAVESSLPCFDLTRNGGIEPEVVIEAFKGRFMLHLTDVEAKYFVSSLLKQAMTASSTAQYDTFQRFSNGISP